MSKLGDDLISLYRNFSEETKKRAKFGINYALLLIEKSDTEKVTRCKNCEWCLSPKYPNKWADEFEFCYKHMCQTEPDKHCGWGTDGRTEKNH